MAAPAGPDPQKRLQRVLGGNFDTEKLKAKFDVSNFSANAVLRGMQLTLVGGRYPEQCRAPVL
jgi:hypothetical protein